MKKKINLSESVYTLTRLYPELIDIMAGLGFGEIRNSIVRKSVGKLMTIPKGAKMKGVKLPFILNTLKAKGFTIEGSDASGEVADSTVSATGKQLELLKNYLRRLGKGEDLENVRKDFKANFQNVEAADIMRAEQELIAEGEPLNKVQKLCDLHSALFHGNTEEERLANTEREVARSVSREQERQWAAQANDNSGKATQLINTTGHPLQTLTFENEALKIVLEKYRKAKTEGTDLKAIVAQARDIAIHYAKKGDLLYPLLKVKYGINGPSQVMWTADDEIRLELSRLAKSYHQDAEWGERADNVMKRAEEMVYKEANILFPLCAANFTMDEWKQIYRDSKDYDQCLGVVPAVWEEAETAEPTISKREGEIVMPGGHLTVEQLTAMLNTLPLEISFVDESDINRFFNEGHKVFKRPSMAIDRSVFSCHPPKIEPMVRAIISDFRTGKRDQVPVWMEKNGHTMLVNYMAVRDRNGRFVGTMEIVQDMEFAKKHFASK